MAKHSLVVVESAAKAKTIEKFLGRNYTVRACLGHVRDLPTSSLGVDVGHEFAPHYVVPKDRREIVKKLKEEARVAENVLLATDPDREGEAIAWHLASALNLSTDRSVRRIEFHEITRGAILEALRHPREIDMHRVEAQQARRVLDRLIGYPVSNFLGKKVRRGLSAGRVQSVAVRLVVDREREIEAFVKREYWSLEADLARRIVSERRGEFTAALVERAGEKIELASAEETAAIQTDLDGADWSVSDVQEREQQRHPAAPFTTSTLQQEASRKLGYSAKRAMAVAQQLYEGVAIGGGETVGLITYMRTDSVTVAVSAQEEAREYIRGHFGVDFVPEAPRVYKTRSKLAQEAHEAIRPTSAMRDPDGLHPYLKPEQFRLYELIWKRFVASQMTSAIFDVTTVQIRAQPPGRPPYGFRATGSRMKFAGFLSVYLEGRDDEEVQDEDRQPLPALTAGDLLALLRLNPEQHFTQPPPRYTEATLVKAMEERGIGRPSTYAPTLSVIQDRGYVERDGRALRPTETGLLVNDLLVRQFEDFMNPDFTAIMEDKLDDVAQGTTAWVPVVQGFYTPLIADLERAESEVERIKPVDIETDEVCSLGHPMVIKVGRFGKFLACATYPEHKETRPLAEELPPNAPIEHCSHGLVMQLRSGRYGPYYTSTHDCGETRTFAQRIGVACPLDKGEIVEKRSKKGRVFFGCGNWPACDWVSWYRPLREECPECGGMQVEMGRGRIHCLKHQGEPGRFGKSRTDVETQAEAGSVGKSLPKRTTVIRKTAKTTVKASAASHKAAPVARKTAPTANKNGTAKGTAKRGPVAPSLV